MRSFTVTENVRRMHPLEPDPFLGLPSGDRTLPPRPLPPRPATN
jgi:hypothetical protein